MDRRRRSSVVGMAVRGIAVVSVIATAACGGDSSGPTGPGVGLTAGQKTALTNLFNRDDVAQLFGLGPADSSFSDIMAKLEDLGTINFGSSALATRLAPLGASNALTPRATHLAGPVGAYQAFGLQMLFAAQSSTGIDTLGVTLIFAVDNLDAPTAVMEIAQINIGTPMYGKAVSFAHVGEDEEPSDTTAFASAYYLKLNNDPSLSNSYFAQSGQITLSSANFESASACSDFTPGDGLLACSVASGTMGTTFEFDAVNLDTVTFEPGTDTVHVPSVTVNNLPTVRWNATVDASEDEPTLNRLVRPMLLHARALRARAFRVPTLRSPALRVRTSRARL